MMDLKLLLCTSLVVTGVFSHMPTVYEFCSHVVANGHEGRGTCDASQCHGRPGKIGPVGPRGIPGFKGDKGDQGTSEELEETVENLRGSLVRLKTLLAGHLPTKENLCFMGMKSNEIPDAALLSSSSWNDGHGPRFGRLDFRGRSGVSGAWCALLNQVGEWYQVDFGKSKSVAGLITQGRYDDYKQWVTSFKVQYGNDTANLETVREFGGEKIFNGNSDQNTKVTNLFPKPIACRYLRIHPQTWSGHISMRFEFIRGECYDFY